MRDVQSLLQDLESPNSSVRDKAALDLMDIGIEHAVAPLVRAILKPENVNHRGTLVYALGAFNCEPVLEILVDLALTGNAEVSIGACGVLEQAATSADAVQRVRMQLRNYVPRVPVPEHQKAAHEALLALTVAAPE